MAVFAALLYAPTLGHDFVWDDPISVRRWLPALGSLAAVFVPPPNIPQFPADYYRPLQLLSYKIDFALGGGAPWAFHATSVLWHAMASALVYMVAARSFRERPFGEIAARASGLVFAAHPIHTESVAWMAARPDPMVTTFVLAAVYLVLAQRRLGVGRLCLVSGLCLFAMLSKENGMATVALLPLVSVLRSQWATPAEGRFMRTEASQIFAATLAAAAGYLLLRYFGLTHYGGVPPRLPEHPFSTLLAAWGWYIGKLLWPFPQNALVAEVPRTRACIAVGLFGVCLSLLVVFRAIRGQRALHLFWVAWFWATLTPSLAVLAVQPSAAVAERYLYLPSAALCWAAGATFAWLTKRHSSPARAFVQIGLFCAVASLATATILRNQVWRDNVTLWSDTASKNPDEGYPLRNLAAALIENGEWQRAEHLLLEALQRRNNRAGIAAIYSNLGTLAFLRRNYQAASNHYAKAFEAQPSPDVAYNLGVSALKLAEPLTGSSQRPHLEEARRWLERAIAMSPHDAEVHFGYAQALLLLGERELARHHLRRSLELHLAEPQATRARELLETLGAIPK